MTPRTIDIDGKRYLWRDIVALWRAPACCRALSARAQAVTLLRQECRALSGCCL
jgi:hypothetical protein